MHRAGIDRAFRHRFRFGTTGQVHRRFRHELVQTSAGAEIKPLALVLVHVARGGAFHRHAADRVRGVYIVIRRCHKLVPAPLTAEVIAVSGAVMPGLIGSGVHGHAANRVPDDGVMIFKVRMRGVQMLGMPVRGCHLSELLIIPEDDDDPSSHWKVKQDLNIFDTLDLPVSGTTKNRPENVVDRR